MLIVTKLYRYLHERKSKKLQETFDIALKTALDTRDNTNRVILNEQIKRNAADREFEQKEFEKERMGFRMQLKEKDLFIDDLKKTYSDKFEALRKRFEDQDKERVKVLTALKDKLSSQLAVISDIRAYWEGSITYTSSAVQRLSSQVEARKLLLMEIIKRVEQLHREGKALEDFENELFSHHAKILKNAPLAEEFFNIIEGIEYKLSNENML